MQDERLFLPIDLLENASLKTKLLSKLFLLIKYLRSKKEMWKEKTEKNEFKILYKWQLSRNNNLRYIFHLWIEESILNFYYFGIIYFYFFFPSNLIITLISSLVYLYLFDLRSPCIVTRKMHLYVQIVIAPTTWRERSFFIMLHDMNTHWSYFWWMYSSLYVFFFFFFISTTRI